MADTFQAYSYVHKMLTVAPTLVDFPGSAVVICDEDAEEGDEFEMEIEFEANPEADSVEWIMQAEEGSETRVEEGDTEGEYNSYQVEDEGRDKYVATMRIDRLDRDDLDIRNNHQLIVENDAGTSTFYITIDTSKGCKKRAGTITRDRGGSQRGGNRSGIGFFGAA